MASGSETRFIAVAVTVGGAAAGLLFADPGVLHSPVSSGALVAGYFAALFAVSQVTNDDRLTLWGYVGVGVSLVGLLLEGTETVGVRTMGGSLVLFLVALALFDLADRYGTPSRFVPRVRAKQVFAAVTVLAVVVVSVDAVSGGLAYELRTGGEVHVAGGSEQVPVAFLGEIVATNPGPFPQRVDIPEYSVCTAGNWSAHRPQTADGETRPAEVHLQADGYFGEYVSGLDEHRYAAILLFDAADVAGERFPVRRTDRCPDDDGGDPYLAVFEASES